MRILFIVLVMLASFGCAAPQQTTPAEVRNLSPQEFKQQRMSGKTVLVDVRTPEEFNEGHLSGATNSDFRGGEFAEQIKNWDKKKVYYLYCASGNRSGKAAELLKAAGFQNIYNLGGYQDLREAGLPIEEGNEE